MLRLRAAGMCLREGSAWMSSSSDWEMPLAVQPKPEHYDYDLDDVLSSLVGLRAIVPGDAFTAETLGTERAGNGVLIRDGVVLTIGYLITEAQTIWLHPADGPAVPGHVLAYDQETGFGLVQALARLDLPILPIGRSKEAKVGDPVVVAGAGGRKHSVVARIAAKQEFAGNWEYVLDEAIFTVPAHPFWGGTAMIGADGALLGIGSLQVQQVRDSGTPEPLNMIVPIDILKPILEDLLTLGRPNHPPRPWLGLNATEIDDKVVVARVSSGGPARRANLRTGDVVLAVAGTKISDLAGFFRKVWSLGRAGVEVPLTIYRDGRTLEARVTSGDRNRFLKGPSLH
jgi:S1-C subfamily serine protease